MKGKFQGKRFSKGLAMRRQVLAAEHVDPQLAKAKGHLLLEPFQQMITEVAYGDVWTREGLSLKTRSMLTVAMLIALNRNHEMQAHMRGAKRNGASFEEIREVILHSAIYAGFPAASDGVRVAMQVYGVDDAGAAIPSTAKAAPKRRAKTSKASAKRVAKSAKG